MNFSNTSMSLKKLTEDIDLSEKLTNNYSIHESFNRLSIT